MKPEKKHTLGDSIEASMRRISDSGMKAARNYSRKMKRTGSATNMNIAGRHTINGRNILPGQRLILQHLPMRSMWVERAAWKMR